jgi:threonylcarbamoyladenosine tRNA methylthiotransferase MtaB
MAGFPGETDAEFEETLAFVCSLPFGYLHLFPFSPRPGTRAWTLNQENPVPRSVVDDRMAALRFLAAEKTSAHRKRFIGCIIDAITLQTPEAFANCGRTSALTENFIPVELNRCLAPNRLIRVQVNGLTADGELNGTFITSKDEGLPAACAAD